MIRNTIPLRIRRSGSLGTVALIGALAATGTARADVTVVSQVAVTDVIQPALDQAVPFGTKPPQRQESSHSPQTVTTYYKGGNARTEMGDGTVVLYEGTDDKIYTLDMAQKTYYVRPFKETLEPTQASTGGPGPAPKVDSSIDIKPGEETRSCVGATAQVYTVDGVITITPQRRGGSGGRGGGGRRHGRGGGFPGGGGGFPLLQRGGYPGGDDQNGNGYPGGFPNRGGQTRSVEVAGEFWVSDAVNLPDDKKASALPALQAALSGGDMALKPLTDSLNKKKEIPLSSRFSLTRTDPRTGAQDSTTTTMQLTSVSPVPLGDALFRPPLGYTQIAPPVPADNGANGGGVNGDSYGRNRGA